MNAHTIRLWRIVDDAQKLLAERKFAELETLMRAEHLGTRVGTSGYVSVRQIDAVLRTKVSCSPTKEEVRNAEQQRARVRAWQQADPTSPHMLTLLAGQLIDQAWDVRGGGFAGTVSEQQFAKFREILQEAKATLLKVNPKDRGPVWFSNMLGVGNALHFPESEYENLFQTARKKFPSQFELYTDAASYYSRRWHGSDDQLVKFIDNAAALNSGSMRDELLARMYVHEHLRQQVPPNTWKRIKLGWMSILKRFPSSSNANAYARQACRAKDIAAMRDAFALTAGNNNEPAIWVAPQELPYCRALLDGPNVECFKRADTGAVLCSQKEKTS